MAKLKTRIRMYQHGDGHIVWRAEYKPSFLSFWSRLKEYSVVSSRDAGEAIRLCKIAIDDFIANSYGGQIIIKYPENQ